MIYRTSLDLFRLTPSTVVIFRFELAARSQYFVDAAPVQIHHFKTPAHGVHRLTFFRLTAGQHHDQSCQGVVQAVVFLRQFVHAQTRFEFLHRHQSVE